MLANFLSMYNTFTCVIRLYSTIYSLFSMGIKVLIIPVYLIIIMINNTLADSNQSINPLPLVQIRFLHVPGSSSHWAGNQASLYPHQPSQQARGGGVPKQHLPIEGLIPWKSGADTQLLGALQGPESV